MSTLNDAFDKASADLEQEDVTDVTDVEEISEDEVSQNNRDGDDAEETRSEEESFTSIDPNALPEELKATYKSLQADYTRKTQEVAKIRKESEQQAKVLEERIRELEKSRQPEVQGSQQLTPQQVIQEAVKGELQAAKIVEFQDNALSAYRNSDPRLNDENQETYDKATDLFVGQRMDELLSDYVKEKGTEIGFDTDTKVKQALEEWDQYLQEQNKKYLERQSKLAKENQKKNSRSNPPATTGRSKPGKMSLEQAIALAQQK